MIMIQSNEFFIKKVLKQYLLLIQILSFLLSMNMKIRQAIKICRTDFGTFNRNVVRFHQFCILLKILEDLSKP